MLSETPCSRHIWEIAYCGRVYTLLYHADKKGYGGLSLRLGGLFVSVARLTTELTQLRLWVVREKGTD